MLAVSAATGWAPQDTWPYKDGKPATADAFKKLQVAKKQGKPAPDKGKRYGNMSAGHKASAQAAAMEAAFDGTNYYKQPVNTQAVKGIDISIDRAAQAQTGTCDLSAVNAAVLARAKQGGGQAWRVRIMVDLFVALAMFIKFGALQSCLDNPGDLMMFWVVDMSLMLVGVKDMGTWLHIEPAAAINFAWGVAGADLALPLATWLFINPIVFESPCHLRRLVCVLSGGTECATPGDTPLTDAELKAVRTWVFQKTDTYTPSLMADIVTALGNDIMGDALAFTIEQMHGAGMYVSVGWAHAVCNLQQCVKLAFEVLRDTDAPQAVFVHNRLRFAWGSVLPPDYVTCTHKSMEYVLNMAKFGRLGVN